MRCLAVAVFLVVACPVLLLGGPGAPTTAPDDLDAIGQSVAGLFDLPYSQQQGVRRELESQPDLPQLLAGLLQHDDPVVRRTSLILLRDDYGDSSVVAAVQTQLAAELAKPAGGDGYVIAACCEILADWPRWDSIPALLDAMRTDDEVSGLDLSADRRRPDRTAVWRQVDASLRLISGEWPMPEPDAVRTARPGSPRDREDQQNLEKTWGQWWTATALRPDPLPQVRIELDWVVSSVDPSGQTRHDAAVASLWVRPTGSARYSRVLGAAAPDDPVWRWTDRCRRDYEWHLNAIQADAVRAVVATLSAAGPSQGLPNAEHRVWGPQPWGIARPVGAPESWRGRVEATTADGRVLIVELADLSAPEAVRPPAPAADALAELLALTVIP